MRGLYCWMQTSMQSQGWKAVIMRPVPGLSHERLMRLARADTGGRMHGSSIGCRLLGGVLRRLYCRFQGTARMDHERPYRMTNTSKPWFRCCGSLCCCCGWQSSAREAYATCRPSWAYITGVRLPWLRTRRGPIRRETASQGESGWVRDVAMGVRGRK